MSIKIIGCGNLIVGNDGLGIRIIEKLRSFSLPDYVELIEGGVRGINLLDYFIDVDKVIIVDAIITGNPPGTLYRFDLNEIEKMSRENITITHQIGIAETVKIGLKLYSDTIAKDIILIGMEIPEINNTFCLELSSLVEKKLPEMIELILKEIIN